MPFTAFTTSDCIVAALRTSQVCLKMFTIVLWKRKGVEESKTEGVSERHRNRSSPQLPSSSPHQLPTA